VSSGQLLLPTGLVWELELSFLVECFSLGQLLVSAPYQFLQGGQMCYFPQAAAGPPNPTRPRSAQHSTLPQPGGGKSFLLFIRPPALSRRNAICPQAIIVYVLSPRVGWCFTLTWNGCTFSLWYLKSVTIATDTQEGIVRGSAYMGPRSSRTIQALSELVQQFFAVSFCS
jgi:hypothetical protein